MSLGMLLAGTFLAGFFGESPVDFMEQSAKDPNAVLAELSLGLGRHGEGGTSSSKNTFSGKTKSKNNFDGAFDRSVEPEGHSENSQNPKHSAFGKSRVQGDRSQLASDESEFPLNLQRVKAKDFGQLSEDLYAQPPAQKLSSSKVASLGSDTGTSYRSLASLELLGRPSAPGNKINNEKDNNEKESDAEKDKRIEKFFNELREASKFKEKQHEAEKHTIESQGSAQITEKEVPQSEKSSSVNLESQEPNPVESRQAQPKEYASAEANVAPLNQPKANIEKVNKSQKLKVPDFPPPMPPELPSLRSQKQAPVPKGQLERLSQTLDNLGVAVSKQSKAVEVLNQALSKIPLKKNKDALLKKVTQNVNKIAFEIYGSEQEMMDHISQTFFPKISPKHLLPEQVQVIDSARKSLTGKVMTALLEEKPINKDEMMKALVDETVKNGLADTIDSNNREIVRLHEEQRIKAKTPEEAEKLGQAKTLDNSEKMKFALLATKLTKETPYINAFKPEVREELLAAVPLAIATFQPELPLTNNSKGATVIDADKFLEVTLVHILKSAQEIALDPADRVQVQAVTHAQSKEIDSEKFGELVRAAFGKKTDKQAAQAYKEIMTEFYDQFARAMLGVPPTESVDDFIASPDFTISMNRLSQLTSNQLQNKIDSAIQFATQGLILDGQMVTASKIISDVFVSEIHPETGLVRRTNSTDRAQIVKDGFSPENYFMGLSKVNPDQVQYSDPDDSSRKINQDAVMTTAHRVVAALHAKVNVRDKLILEAQKAEKKKGEDFKRHQQLAKNLKAKFGTLLKDPTPALLGKNQNITTLKSYLAKEGIEPSDEMLTILSALKNVNMLRKGAMENFAKDIANVINKDLNLPSSEELGRSLMDYIGVNKPDNPLANEVDKSTLAKEIDKSILAKEIGQLISHSLCSQALSQIAKGEKVQVAPPPTTEVLWNALKATGNMPDDLERILKKPLSAEGFVFTEEEKQSINAQVLFGLITKAKQNLLPRTATGKTDITKFNGTFAELANDAYKNLHPKTAVLPFKADAEDAKVDYDISGRIPTLLKAMHNAIEDFANGDFTKIANSSRTDLLNIVLNYLIRENLIDKDIQNHTRSYFESVMNALESQFLSKLRVGKRLEQFGTLDELIATIMPAQQVPNLIVPSIDDLDGPPPPPPPPPPFFGATGNSGPGMAPPPPPQFGSINTGKNYKLNQQNFPVNIKDPAGTGKSIDQTITVDPVHILLALPSLWSEATKSKDLAEKRRELEEKNALLIKQMAVNLEDLLRGQLQLKQPVVAVQQIDTNQAPPQLKKKFTLADLDKAMKEIPQQYGLGTVVYNLSTGQPSDTKLSGVSGNAVDKAAQNAAKAKPALESISAKDKANEQIQLNPGKPSQGEKSRFKVKRGLGKATSFPDPLKVN